MYEDETGRRNASGLPDPTYRSVSEAVRREGRENSRRCVRAMLAVATSLGCDVLSRIEVRDRASGEVSR